MRPSSNQRQAFTLVELLLAMGIISVLALIVLVAINPMRQLEQSRNAVREADTQQILRAIQQYVVDNESPADLSITTNLQMIGTDAGNECDIPCGGDSTGPNCLDLSDLVPDYLAELPVDILNGSDEQTYYAVQLLGDNRIHVRACGAEDDVVIAAEQ